MNAPSRKAPGRQKKRLASIAVDQALIDRARSAGLDPGAVLVERLTELLRTEDAEKWRRENAEAIKARNDRVARYGLYADSIRKW